MCILFSFGRFDLRVGAEGPWLFRASCVHAYMVMPAVLRIRYVCLKSKIIIRKYAHIRHMIPFARAFISHFVRPHSPRIAARHVRRAGREGRAVYRVMVTEDMIKMNVINAQRKAMVWLVALRFFYRARPPARPRPPSHITEYCIVYTATTQSARSSFTHGRDREHFVARQVRHSRGHAHAPLSRRRAGHERIEKHIMLHPMEPCMQHGPATHGMHVALPLDACFTRG